jgi:hypothetical protein
MTAPRLSVLQIATLFESAAVVEPRLWDLHNRAVEAGQKQHLGYPNSLRDHPTIIEILKRRHKRLHGPLVKEAIIRHLLLVFRKSLPPSKRAAVAGNRPWRRGPAKTPPIRN